MSCFGDMGCQSWAISASKTHPLGWFQICIRDILRSLESGLLESGVFDQTKQNEESMLQIPHLKKFFSHSNKRRQTSPSQIWTRDVTLRPQVPQCLLRSKVVRHVHNGFSTTICTTLTVWPSFARNTRQSKQISVTKVILVLLLKKSEQVLFQMYSDGSLYAKKTKQTETIGLNWNLM